ncbi:MAG: hypothetical protein ACOZCO_05155 [Bacteroidota bacterium]
MTQKKNTIVIESMSKKQLLSLLGIPTYKRLRTKLKPYEKLIGKLDGRSYSAKQVELIVALLGVKKEVDPDSVDSIENKDSLLQKRIEEFENKKS